MRALVAAMCVAGLGACTTLTGGVVHDLGPVYADPMAHNGRTFEGEVYIIADPADPQTYRLSQSADGEQFFGIHPGAQQRVQDWYHMRPGQRFLARGLLRPTACGERGACSPGEPAFDLLNLQILRRPGQ